MSRNPIPPRVPPKGVGGAMSPASRSLAGAAVPAKVASESTAVPVPSMARVVNDQVSTSSEEAIVARAATYYRTTRYIMVVLLLGMGGWFGYDGFKGWPAENASIKSVNQQLDKAKVAQDKDAIAKLTENPLSHKMPHSNTDILIQKVLAFGLPVGSVSMLLWALYNSRGEYRLAGNVLSAPGHRAVRLQDITQVDKQLWDRKGIAYVSYSGASGNGRVCLDDFIYEREPTDEIYNRITSFLSGVTPQPDA